MFCPDFRPRCCNTAGDPGGASRPLDIVEAILGDVNFLLAESGHAAPSDPVDGDQAVSLLNLEAPEFAFTARHGAGMGASRELVGKGEEG